MGASSYFDKLEKLQNLVHDSPVTITKKSNFLKFPHRRTVT